MTNITVIPEFSDNPDQLAWTVISPARLIYSIILPRQGGGGDAARVRGARAARADAVRGRAGGGARTARRGGGRVHAARTRPPRALPARQQRLRRAAAHGH